MMSASKALGLLKEIGLFVLRFKRNCYFLDFTLDLNIKNTSLKRNKLFNSWRWSKFLLVCRSIMRWKMRILLFGDLSSWNYAFNIRHYSSSSIGSTGRIAIYNFNWMISGLISWNSQILLRIGPRINLKILSQNNSALVIFWQI